MNTFPPEFVRYDVCDYRAIPARGQQPWKAPRYVAFVLHSHDPSQLHMVPLGDAGMIERLVADFRKEVVGEDSRHIGVQRQTTTTVSSQTSHDLRQAVIDPLMCVLHNCTRWFIAPDGDLSLVPFEALAVDSTHRLIDFYHISYLSSGREAVGFGDGRTCHPALPVVIADPNFDLKVAGRTAKHDHVATFTHHGRELERSRLRFHRLPGTRIEGEMVASLLGVPPLLESDALEGTLKSSRSPLILHIATHGFFLHNQHDLPHL